MTQMKNKVKYLGIDCAKESFESFLEDDNQTHCWNNNAEGIQAVKTWMDQQADELVVVVEPTGGYERKLLSGLYDLGVSIALVGGLRVRYFAKSEGQKAKTDPIDAEMLARFGREKKPPLWQPRSEETETLRELVGRRRHISDMISEEKIHLEQATGFTREDILHTIPQLQQKEAALEARIEAHLQACRQFDELYKRLQQPKGIGPVTAYTILAYMPELGSISDKRAASLAGLAPYTKTSGKYKGKTFTFGGRKQIRKPLHMAAKVARKHNAILKQFYESLIQRGINEKAALTAVMRKLIVLMNRIAANPEFSLQI